MSGVLGSFRGFQPCSIAWQVVGRSLDVQGPPTGGKRGYDGEVCKRGCEKAVILRLPAAVSGNQVFTRQHLIKCDQARSGADREDQGGSGASGDQVCACKCLDPPDLEEDLSAVDVPNPSNH